MDYIAQLIYLLLAFTFVKAVIIDPRSPGSAKINVVCQDNDQVLQLTNPFDNSEDLLFFEWLRKANNASANGVSLMQKSAGDIEPTIKADRVSRFQQWGIQVKPVTFEDSGIYEAAMVTKSGTDSRKKVQVVVASPPVLKSPNLKVEEDIKGNISIVRCGQVQTLGVPPVKLIILSGNGSVLSTSYDNGFLTLKLDSKIESGQFQCLIEDSSPAKSCIPEFDLEKWDSFLKVGNSKGPSSAGATWLIVGVVIGVVVLIIIIIIVCCCVKKHKKDKDGTYNAKKEAEEKGLQEMSRSDNDFDPDKAPYLSSKASSASPYMVTGLKLGNDDTNHYACVRTNQPSSCQIYKSPPLATTDSEDDVDLQRERHNRENRAGSGGKNMEPPVPMKRNKYFTNSTEGLNLIEPPREEHRWGNDTTV